MEDERRLKECWVVLTDCRYFLPNPQDIEHPVNIEQDRDASGLKDSPCGSDSLEGANNSCSSSGLAEFSAMQDAILNVLPKLKSGEQSESVISKYPAQLKESCDKVNEVNIIRGNRVNKYKTNSSRKLCKKRRRSVDSNPTAAAIRMKTHLSAKYGSALLQNSSLNVDKMDIVAKPASNSTCVDVPSDSSLESADNNFLVPDVEQGKKSISNASADIECLNSPPSKNARNSIPCDAQKSTILQSKLDDSPHIVSNRKNLETTKFSSNMDCEVVGGQGNQLFSNPSCPMPAVGLVIDVGVGHKLSSLQAKCVLTCLGSCTDSLSCEYAKFCSSVAVSSSKVSTEKVILPIKDERILQFMQIKWKAKSVVQRLPSSSISRTLISAAGNQCTNLNELQAPSPVFDTVSDSAKKSTNVLAEKHTENCISLSEEIMMKSISDKRATSDCKSNKRQLNSSCDSLGDESPPKRKRRGNSERKNMDAEHQSNFDLNNSSCSDNVCDTNGNNQDCKEEIENQLGVPSKHSKLTLIAGKEEKLVDFQDDIETVSEKSSSMVRKFGPRRKKKMRNMLLTRNSANSDDEIQVKATSNFPESSYDPDDTRGIIGSEDVVEEPKETTRGRSSHLMHELRRLNVAIFDMTSSQEPIVCKTPDICKLGCVCCSLSAQVVRDNCGLEKCIFGCVCLRPQTSRIESSNPSYTWVQNKAKANLAKEERHFKQTVVRSGNDNLILVQGRSKREIKLPNRYREDFVPDGDLHSIRQFGSMKSNKTLTDDDPNATKKDQSQLRGHRKIKDGSDNTTPQILSPPDKDEHIYVNDSNKETTMEDKMEKYKSLSLNENETARTVPYTSMRAKQLLPDNSPDKNVEDVGDLKIVSTHSLGIDDWEETDTTCPNLNSSAVPASHLFDEEYNLAKSESVVILDFDALKHDIAENKVYLWLKLKQWVKPKIFLTNKYVKPSQNCVDLETIDVKSKEFENLPLYVKALKSDHTLNKTLGKCMWIAKYVKSHWMIVGYLKPGQEQAPRCEAMYLKRWEEQYQETGADLNPKTSGKNELDVISSMSEYQSYRWWVMDIAQNFDLIYFLDFKKAVTKQQIMTLVKLSNEYPESENKVHRILLNRRRPKIDPRPTPYPDFGAYTLPNRPSVVFLGPYDTFKEPKFHVYEQKIARNGKTEYEKIPLFYCGGGECVRVNSQGVLSLNSEDLPQKYVLGLWYESCGKDFREVCERQDNSKLTKQQVEIETGPQTNKEQHSYDNEGPLLNISDNSDEESSATENKSPQHCNKDPVHPIAIMDHKRKEEVSSEPLKPLPIAQPRPISGSVPTKKVAVSLLRKEQNPKIRSLSNALSDANVQKANTGSAITDGQKRQQVKTLLPSRPRTTMHYEYLVPNVRDIGVIRVAHLPSGALSVPHFTQIGMLKFFHSIEDLTQDLNKLIHSKLACLYFKCSVALRKSDTCKCVVWKSFTDPAKWSHLPVYSPEIFNGFHMLTEYGLLDMRCADHATLQRLGLDWIRWLKNDELKIKLHAWKKKQEEELKESQRKGSKVLNASQSSNFTLHQALMMTTNEIAEGKVEEQLPDHENQVQKLVKENLINSLCRKLHGIPGEVVPNLLEHLNVSLLWDVLQCMNNWNSNNSDILTKQNSPPKLSSLLSDDVTHFPSEAVRDGVIRPIPQSRLLKKMWKQVDAEDEQSSSKPLEQIVDQHEQQIISLEHRKNKLPLRPKQKGSEEKEGLACQLSGFTRLNVSVEEGGIKICPLQSPPRSSTILDTFELQSSPVKPPNILKKNKIITIDMSPGKDVCHSMENHNLKKARKQTFSQSIENEEVPVFEDDLDFENDSSPQTSTLLFNQESSVPSLKISSVTSGSSYWQDPVSIVPSAQSEENNETESSSKPQNTVSQSNPISSSTSKECGSSLKISSVFSTREPSLFVPAEVPQDSLYNQDSVPSLQISSVVSRASLESSSEPPTSNLQENLSFQLPSNTTKINAKAQGASPSNSAPRSVTRKIPKQMSIVRKIVKVTPGKKS